MTNEAFLDVDGTERYQYVKDILNNVFNKRKEDGEEYEGAQKSVWDIAPGKKVWFPYLAVIDPANGGWKTPKKVGWINIPSPDARTISQIPLVNCKYFDPNQEVLEDIEYAVFVTDTTDPTDKYRFYGIFTKRKLDKDGISVWSRISATLLFDEWKTQG